MYTHISHNYQPTRRLVALCHRMVLIVADIMAQEFTIRVMVTQLRLVGVRLYVTQNLIAATFHTALNGRTVICAPHANSPVEMESTTHLGKRSQVRCLSKFLSRYYLF